MQTHINETEDEVLATSNIFPHATDYLMYMTHLDCLLVDHYLRTGSTQPNLNTRDGPSGASVIHCPTSNTFLGSGLFDASGYISRDINIGMGSDVGGESH